MAPKMVIYRNEFDFIIASWTIYDADEQDWSVGDDTIIFTSVRFENAHTQACTHMFEVFHLLLFKQQLFTNVLGHISVDYDHSRAKTNSENRTL